MDKSRAVSVILLVMVAVFGVMGCGTTPTPRSGAIQSEPAAIQIIKSVEQIAAYLDGIGESFPELPTLPGMAEPPDPAMISEYAQTLRQSRPTLQEQIARQVFGLDNRGYVELRPHLDLEDSARKNELQKMAASENKTRKELYRELARIYRDVGASLTMVERDFALAAYRTAPAGTSLQVFPEGAHYESMRAFLSFRDMPADEFRPSMWVKK